MTSTRKNLKRLGAGGIAVSILLAGITLPANAMMEPDGFSTFGITIEDDGQLAAHGVSLDIQQLDIQQRGNGYLYYSASIDPSVAEASLPAGFEVVDHLKPIEPHEASNYPETREVDGQLYAVLAYEGYRTGGVSVRLMSPTNHDEGVWESPFRAGDVMPPLGAADGGINFSDPRYKRVDGSWQEDPASTSIFQKVNGHTSYFEGGVPDSSGEVPYLTVAADDFAATAGEDYTAARAEMGYLTHNPATLSDATDGDTTVVIQLVATDGESGYQVALTDGITVRIDTSGTTWDATPVDADGWKATTYKGSEVAMLETSEHTATHRVKTTHTVKPEPEASVANFQARPVAEAPDTNTIELEFQENADGTVSPIFWRGALGATYTFVEQAENAYEFRVGADNVGWEPGATFASGTYEVAGGQVVAEFLAVDVDGTVLISLVGEGVELAPRTELTTGLRLDVNSAPTNYYWMGSFAEDEQAPLVFANDDAATTVENNSVVIRTFDNDSEGDSDFIYVDGSEVVESPRNGSVELIVDSFLDPWGDEMTVIEGYRYTPDNGFSGTDEFVYEVRNYQGESDVATVRIDVIPLNAQDDVQEGRINTPLEIDILANDTWHSPDFDFRAWYGDHRDHEWNVSFTEPEHGTVELKVLDFDEAIERGIPFVAVYTPEQDFVGTDRFTYTWVNPESVERSANVEVVISGEVAQPEPEPEPQPQPEPEPEKKKIPVFDSETGGVFQAPVSATNPQVADDSPRNGLVVGIIALVMTLLGTAGLSMRREQ